MGLCLNFYITSYSLGLNGRGLSESGSEEKRRQQQKAPQAFGLYEETMTGDFYPKHSLIAHELCGTEGSPK